VGIVSDAKAGDGFESTFSSTAVAENGRIDQEKVCQRPSRAIAAQRGEQFAPPSSGNANGPNGAPGLFRDALPSGGERRLASGGAGDCAANPIQKTLSSSCHAFGNPSTMYGGS